jgi:hypothetical protein
MTATLKSKPDMMLLPEDFTCLSCKAVTEITEYRNLSYSRGGSGIDDAGETISTTCLACGCSAFPPQGYAKKLIASYKLWQVTDPKGFDTIWGKNIDCPICNRKPYITEDNLVVIDRSVAHSGDSWEPETNIACPLCHSLHLAGHNVPQYIIDRVVWHAAHPND